MPPQALDRTREYTFTCTRAFTHAMKDMKAYKSDQRYRAYLQQTVRMAKHVIRKAKLDAIQGTDMQRRRARLDLLLAELDLSLAEPELHSLESGADADVFSGFVHLPLPERDWTVTTMGAV
jgi:hypothetical protein